MLKHYDATIESVLDLVFAPIHELLGDLLPFLAEGPVELDQL